jgi:DNA-binding NtrC family response regulator
MKKTILLISDEAAVEQAASGVLAEFSLTAARSANAAAELIAQKKPSLVIIDHDLKEGDGLQVFRQLRPLLPYTNFIMLSHANDIPLAVRAAKLGVADFLKKPIMAKELRGAVERNIASSEELALAAPETAWLQGASPALKKMFELIREALPALTNIVLVAERGINKSDVADYAHRRGRRRKSRLRVIDLAAFRRENLEGSFWATVQEAVGENGSAVDEEDRCGTLYLENIESLEESFRLSLFEFFKEPKAKFDPEVLVLIGVYDRQSLPSDLAKNYLEIEVPPLRERKVDLPLLVSRELSSYARLHDKKVRALSSDLLYLLGLYDWPGNYHELAALLEIGVLSAAGEILEINDLPLDFNALMSAAVRAAHTKGKLSLEEAKRWLEKLTYKTLLGKTNGDLGAVARFLDLPKTMLAERTAELGSDLLN